MKKSYYDLLYGNCLRFNIHGDYNVLGSNQYILQIVGYIGLNLKGLYPGNGFSSGLIISISDVNKYVLNWNGIALKSGTFAQMVSNNDIITYFPLFIQNVNIIKALSKTRSSQMPQPYSSCLAAESITNNITQEMARYNLSYIHDICFMFCVQMNIVLSFGCYDMSLPGAFNASPCYDFTVYTQLSSFYFMNVDQCNQLCPIECETVTYDVSVSYSDFPSYQTFISNYKYWDKIASLLGTTSNNLTIDMFRSNFAAAGFYFSQLQYTQIEESAQMTAIDLIGSVGGTLGLFTGFSILVIVEFIELFLKIVTSRCESRVN